MAPEVREAVISKDWQLPSNGQGTRQYPVTEREPGQRLRIFGFRVRGVKHVPVVSGDSLL